MDASSIIGYAGAFIIVLSWIPQIINFKKSKTIELNYNFVLLYITGSLLLLTYSLLIKDIPFIILNSFASLLSLYQLLLLRTK